MTPSTNDVVRNNAVNPVIKSDDLTTEEREMIRQKRLQESEKAKAVEFYLQIKRLEEQMGLSIKTTSCDARLIKDPQLKATRLEAEHQAQVDSLKAQLAQVRALSEQRAAAASLLALAGGLMYGALIGKAAGQVTGAQEGVEAAIKAAGPLGKLLRRRLEK
jgi:hypothetical protein